jgi:hypothetical protein
MFDWKIFHFSAARQIKGKIFLAVMSFVHLTIVRRNTVYQLNVHYRTALRILEQGPDALKSLPGKYRDAGWLVIDYDKKKIVSGQDAFAVQNRAAFEILEVL